MWLKISSQDNLSTQNNIPVMIQWWEKVTVLDRCFVNICHIIEGISISFLFYHPVSPNHKIFLSLNKLASNNICMACRKGSMKSFPLDSWRIWDMKKLSDLKITFHKFWRWGREKTYLELPASPPENNPILSLFPSACWLKLLWCHSASKNLDF